MKKPKGYSLVELMVVAPMIVIASYLVFVIMLRGWQAYQYSLAQTDASFTLTNSLDRVSRVLRSTNTILAASGNDLTVESYFSPRDAIPDHARYYDSNGKLYVDVIPASGAGPNYTYDPASTKTLNIATLTNNASQPFFRYYDQNGNLLSSPYVLASITEIEVTMSVNPKPTILKSNQTTSTRIQLRNRKTNL